MATHAPRVRVMSTIKAVVKADCILGVRAVAKVIMSRRLTATYV